MSSFSLLALMPLLLPMASAYLSSLQVDEESAPGGALLQVEAAAQIAQVSEVAHSSSQSQAGQASLHSLLPEEEQIEIWRELITEKEKVLDQVLQSSKIDSTSSKLRKDLEADIQDLWTKISEESKHQKQELDDSAFFQGGLKHRTKSHLINKASKAPCKFGVLCQQADVPAFTALSEGEEHKINRFASRMPDGPVLMNKTLMKEKALPFGAKHSNTQTVIEDWMSEYPSSYNPPEPVITKVVVEKSAPKATPAPASTNWLSGETVAILALTISALILGTLHWLSLSC